MLQQFPTIIPEMPSVTLSRGFLFIAAVLPPPPGDFLLIFIYSFFSLVHLLFELLKLLSGILYSF